MSATRRARFLRAYTLALLSILFSLYPADAQAPGFDRKKPLHIGLSTSLFREVPEALFKLGTPPFQALVESETGMTAEFVPVKNPDQLGELLTKEKAHLGVFSGVEFAWVRQKYPKLRPLAIAVNQNRHPQVYVMVHQDSPAVCLDDLKSKAFALPRSSKQHCRLFFDKQCCPRSPAAPACTPGTAEEALDEVFEGTVPAAVVDGVALKCYERRKPGRFLKLKALGKPEVFPATVVVYHEGTIDQATLQDFCEGMVHANQHMRGRHVLTLWKMTGFEPIPEDYEQLLTNIIKVYPPAGSP